MLGQIEDLLNGVEKVDGQRYRKPLEPRLSVLYSFVRIGSFNSQKEVIL